MSLEVRIRSSKTSQWKVIFHNTVNDNETLFGGIALKWMDEVAYISATRFSRHRVTTVSMEKVSFKKPITPGSIIEILGEVISTRGAKIDVMVQIFIENIDNNERAMAVEAIFTFTAIDENNHPVRIDDLAS
ncbi:MAG: acyl-CoA thioesterase [Bacteroidetes bacterium]|nr:acyl-CoA thioesterase [Bacteroidota bacterium]